VATVRIIITLKPGILDAAGQAVRQGLHALGYAQVTDVRVGRYLEITVPEGLSPEEAHEMCARFLANPLIEEWRLDLSALRAARPSRGAGGEARGPEPEAREVH